MKCGSWPLQVAYLEKLRSEKLHACGVMIQKHIRGWLAKVTFGKMKRSALAIQCRVRGIMARRLAKLKRDTRAAVVIQANYKAYKARAGYLAKREMVVKLQVSSGYRVDTRNFHEYLLHNFVRFRTILLMCLSVRLSVIIT